MDGVSVIRSGFAGAHMWFSGTVGDVTQEQANTVPPGVAHPISALMAHIIQSEDILINMFIQGSPPLWQRDGWAEKIGGEPLLVQERAVSRAYTCDPQVMNEYGQAVFANTDAALSGLTDADLDRELELIPLGFPNNMSMGVFLSTMLLGNTYAHTGEISFLKGAIMEMKGFPF